MASRPPAPARRRGRGRAADRGPAHRRRARGRRRRPARCAGRRARGLAAGPRTACVGDAARADADRDALDRGAPRRFARRASDHPCATVRRPVPGPPGRAAPGRRPGGRRHVPPARPGRPARRARRAGGRAGLPQRDRGRRRDGAAGGRRRPGGLPCLRRVRDGRGDGCLAGRGAWRGGREPRRREPARPRARGPGHGDAVRRRTAPDAAPRRPRHHRPARHRPGRRRRRRRHARPVGEHRRAARPGRGRRPGPVGRAGPGPRRRRRGRGPADLARSPAGRLPQRRRRRQGVRRVLLPLLPGRHHRARRGLGEGQHRHRDGAGARQGHLSPADGHAAARRAHRGAGPRARRHAADQQRLLRPAVHRAQPQPADLAAHLGHRHRPGRPSNGRGTTGTMDPAVVEIFKRWGFRWGGDWSYTDPMHFELGAVLSEPPR